MKLMNIIILLAACLATATQALTTDKEALYKKYPQLLSAETDPCVRGINQLFINMGTANLQEVMVLSSMHGLNDLGSESGCQNGSFGDLASFSTLTLNVTHIPISLISGFCLPVECTQAQLAKFSAGVTSKFNNLLIAAQKKLHIFDFDKGHGLIKDYTRL